MNIYSQIKTACSIRRLQVQDVEEKAGLGFKTTYNWRKSAPAADKLLKVAKILDTTMEYLMGETEDINASLVSGPVDEQAVNSVEESELLEIFRSVSVEGKAAIITAARAFAGQVDYTKKESANVTA